MLSITPVILSGGSGTRLWPNSRAEYPKQFLSLTSNLSLIQQTAGRLENIRGVKLPIILANQKHRFLVSEHMSAIGCNVAKIILEPCARNTAPAIALAALAQSKLEDSILLILPADHIINDEPAFHSAIARALPFCEDGKLVTFGVHPDRAATEFGYIKSGAELGNGVYESAEFVEKPDDARAVELVKSQQYTWNSGIFMFKASTYINQLTKYCPAIVKSCAAALDHAEIDLDFIKVDRLLFSESPSISIDYAVMEKTLESVVVPVDMGWSDIGSWSALHALEAKGGDQNVLNGDVIVHDVRNSLIISDKKLVAAIGLDNIVLVESDDAILISTMDRVKDVGSLVTEIKRRKRPEAEIHRKVYRPWGHYDSIESGEGFQVKRLVVKPGQKLSLQLHHHRAEHWVVVSGVADVTNGERDFKLNVNQSTYIPIGVKHSLANFGAEDLEIIEVQSGSYLGEDDIVRFEDVYGRHRN
ncbi:MAG: mannose-1-phosphate guanylyltransferase/mannose-6-phosphate isomerase [Arenicella sp.]|jgi:mannose-1-phosphate guanylyltransferase/mannose-6-phosphate isomerase